MQLCKQNLTTKVASSFLFLSLMAVGVVGGVTFIRAREALKQAAFNQLSVTAFLKKEEIVRWFEGQQRDFLLINQFPDVQRNRQILLSSKSSEADRIAAYKILSNYLKGVAELKPNFREIFILDRSNRVILSTNKSREGSYEILANITYFEKVQLGNTFAPIFYVSSITGKPTVTFATPVRDANGVRQGLILAHLNLERIDRIVRERKGLGETGETYLVGSIVSKNTFISREQSKAQEFPNGVSSQGIDAAMKGVSGSGLYRNYAGVPVIGVYRWLNDPDIALLVEMHQEEAFAPARQLAVTIVLVGLVSVGVLLTGVHWLTRQLKLSREQLENYSHRLEVKAQEADASNRAKSQFLANMSHELRTPLNAILGFTQLLTREPSLDTQQKKYLGIITRSGEHLLALINDVLEMSKIESGRIALNLTSFDLYHVLNSIEEMLQLKAQSKGLQLLFERASDLPQYVQTDESKLRQILINLLGNAVKFTKEGSVTLRIVRELKVESSTSSNLQPSNLPLRGKLREQPLTLIFEVEDTGPGIAPHELEKLFEAFVQTETGRKSNQGTGLGLSISRRFVQLMGGDITVRSVLGKGTTFKFDVQVSLAQQPTLETQPPSQRVIRLAPDQSNYRILIVEDQRENRQLLAQLLTSVGFEVEVAENGQDGVALWESWEPHLIWMDMRMPVMDGYEATKRIRAHLQGQAIAIIALTASAFEEERAVVLSAGCDDFVRKPFREDTIFEQMAKHLGVRYVYEGTQNQNPDFPLNYVLSESLTTEALTSLPTDWLTKLQQATIRLDWNLMVTLIDQIRTLDTALADMLLNWANNFEYDKILTFIQQAAQSPDE
jgi:signal transduction histidine kinase/DNA-binding NarL/FixJ family response regulator